MSLEKSKITWQKTDKVKLGIMLIGLVIGTWLLCEGISILYIYYKPIVMLPVLMVVYGIAIIVKVFKHYDYALKG